jgi:hypothetical protein
MRRILILPGFLFLHQLTFGIYMSGSLLTKSNELILCEIDVPCKVNGEIDFKGLHWKVDVKYGDGKTIRLKPENIREFKFKFDNKEYKYVSFRNDYELIPPVFCSTNNVFFKVEEEGYLTLYRFFLDTKFAVGIDGIFITVNYRASSYYLSKNKSLPIKFKQKSDLTKMISEDEELSEIMKKSKIYFDEIKTVVKMYNKWVNNNNIPANNPNEMNGVEMGNDVKTW